MFLKFARAAWKYLVESVVLMQISHELEMTPLWVPELEEVPRTEVVALQLDPSPCERRGTPGKGLSSELHQQCLLFQLERALPQ